MLSDKIPHKRSPKTPKKLNGRAHRWYSDDEKLEAVKMWLMLGSMPLTAAALNIPFDTIKTWRYSKWWGEVVQELKTESSIQLSNKLQKIVDKSLEVIQDRLEHGDYFYDQKTGELVRRPVAMRDALNAANGFLERKMQIEKKPDEKVQQQVQDRLASLADAFSQMARKTRKIEVMDAIQIEGPSQVDVLPETTDGQEMGSEDTFNEETTEKEE